MEQTLSVLEKTETGIVTTLLGMGTVFVVLIVLILVVSALKAGFNKKPEPVTPPQIRQITAPESLDNSPTDDLQLVAVITAALAAYLGSEQASGLKVNSIRRITSLESGWASSARQETIAARQGLYQ
jgi:sodium pump decarboxylase gamma subunit